MEIWCFLSSPQTPLCRADRSVQGRGGYMSSGGAERGGKCSYFSLFLSMEFFLLSSLLSVSRRGRVTYTDWQVFQGKLARLILPTFSCLPACRESICSGRPCGKLMEKASDCLFPTELPLWGVSLFAWF